MHRHQTDEAPGFASLWGGVTQATLLLGLVRGRRSPTITFIHLTIGGPAKNLAKMVSPEACLGTVRPSKIRLETVFPDLHSDRCLCDSQN